MLRIFRYLKPYTLSIIAVLILLFAQAMGELALPNYMSDIVNVGIQQGGVESAVPEAIRAAFDQVCRQRQLTITVEGLETLPVIDADTEALRKAFHHLLVNAVKYTPDGGTITVSGHLLPPGDEEFLDGGVEIVVSDTGIGIDPSAQQLIFTKFYQTGEVATHSSGSTKFKGGGPGLGLHIAKGIIESHGGTIWVESPGYDEMACPGSTFHVLLPMRSEPPDTRMARLFAPLSQNQTQEDPI